MNTLDDDHRQVLRTLGGEPGRWVPLEALALQARLPAEHVTAHLDAIAWHGLGHWNDPLDAFAVRVPLLASPAGLLAEIERIARDADDTVPVAELAARLAPWSGDAVRLVLASPAASGRLITAEGRVVSLAEVLTTAGDPVTTALRAALQVRVGRWVSVQALGDRAFYVGGEAACDGRIGAWLLEQIASGHVAFSTSGREVRWLRQEEAARRREGALAS